jgi:hypothetical protein
MFIALFKETNPEMRSMIIQVLALRAIFVVFIVYLGFVLSMPNYTDHMLGMITIGIVKFFMTLMGVFLLALFSAMFSFQAFDAVLNERCWWLLFTGYMMQLTENVKKEEVAQLGFKKTDFIRLDTTVVAVKSKKKGVLLRLYAA